MFLLDDEYSPRSRDSITLFTTCNIDNQSASVGKSYVKLFKLSNHSASVVQKGADSYTCEPNIEQLSNHSASVVQKGADSYTCEPNIEHLSNHSVSVLQKGADSYTCAPNIEHLHNIAESLLIIIQNS